MSLVPCAQKNEGKARPEFNFDLSFVSAEGFEGEVNSKVAGFSGVRTC